MTYEQGNQASMIDQDTRQKIRKDNTNWRVFFTYRNSRVEKREGTFTVSSPTAEQAMCTAYAQMIDEAVQSDWASWSIDGIKLEQGPKNRPTTGGQTS